MVLSSTEALRMARDAAKQRVEVKTGIRTGEDACWNSFRRYRHVHKCMVPTVIARHAISSPRLSVVSNGVILSCTVLWISMLAPAELEEMHY
ncbi:hypothetical protein RB195_006189 [Necator americanus]|uniref:Uncharacterized protein n=1 Tax=Necator americanus TaxID=51031 RepID=A0ABR1BUT4_NECAM